MSPPLQPPYRVSDLGLILWKVSNRNGRFMVKVLGERLQIICTS